MDELVNQVAQKTGISHDQARDAVNTVVGFLKEKLPEPVAAQLDAALAGGDVSKIAGDLAGGLGGMLGGH